jgi:thiol-disulfide isomerase/thioredoxin
MSRNIKILALITVFLIYNNTSTAQVFSLSGYSHTIVERNNRWSREIIKELKIGDTIPNFLLAHVDNWPSTAVHLSDFRKKLTIIDFWGIMCGGCINSIPKEEKLQAEFGSKMQIILVTRDTRSAVDYAKANYAYVKDCKLPMYNDDQHFYKYFPYKALPRFVWTDENRVVRAMGLDILNRNSLQQYFDKGIAPAVQNDDVYFDFDHKAPGFFEGGGRNFDKVRYFSVIMDTVNGLGGNDRIDVYRDSVTKAITKLYIDNYSLLFVWRVLLMEENNAYEGLRLGYVWDPKRFLYEVSDSSIFKRAGVQVSGDDAVKLISYELQVPDRPDMQATTFMRSDLERYFKISFNIEKRSVACWVLRKTGSNDPVREQADQNILRQPSRSVKESSLLYDEASSEVIVKNNSGEEFLYWMIYDVKFANPNNALPIVISEDDSASIGKFNLRLKNLPVGGKDKTQVSFEDLKTGLENAGYSLSRERIPIPMIIVRDIH